jgi:hypothetical protein
MVSKRDSWVLGSFNMVILTSFSIHERHVALLIYHSTVFVCKVRFFPCGHLGSDRVKFCCKNNGGFGFILQNPLAELSHPPDRSVLVLPCHDYYKLKLGF